MMTPGHYNWPWQCPCTSRPTLYSHVSHSQTDSVRSYGTGQYLWHLTTCSSYQLHIINQTPSLSSDLTTSKVTLVYTCTYATHHLTLWSDTHHDQRSYWLSWGYSLPWLSIWHLSWRPHSTLLADRATIILWPDSPCSTLTHSCHLWHGLIPIEPLQKDIHTSSTMGRGVAMRVEVIGR